MIKSPNVASGIAILSWRADFSQTTLPPDALQQLHQVVGNRIEAVNIPGGDYAAAGDIYGYTVNGWLVLDFLGSLWKVKRIGLGFSYFLGHDYEPFKWKVEEALHV